MGAFTAILIGFMGSFHCIGMCGPIAMALPVSGGYTKRLIGLLTYNGGRILTYSLLGALFGGIGYVSSLFGLQQTLSILIGIFILLQVFSKTNNRFNRLFSGLFPFQAALRKCFSHFLRKRGLVAYCISGLLNGLLPCGLVYLGLSGAAAQPSIEQGAMFMALFGLGTLPTMLLVPVVGQWANQKFRMHIRRVLPALTVLVALVFILRGLGLGIPYISPQVLSDSSSIVICGRP